ncbi:hypothetical protein BH10ACT1_BH10ACT1_42900 [soil metagenome]
MGRRRRGVGPGLARGKFWADHSDPDGTDPGASDGPSELHLSPTFRGRFDARGTFSGHDGSTLADAIAPIEAAIHASEQATGQITTPAQRRAQALMMLIAQATATDPDQALPNQPSMGVVIDWDTLHRSLPTTLDPRRGFAHGPIDPATAQQIACDSIITRILLGPSSEILDIGRAARTPTVAQRKALKVRDGGCTFPDCGRPVAWTHAHHIHWWSHDGPTDLANLTLLCTFHHRLIHTKHFTVQRLGDGRLQFRRPDGTPIHGRNPNHGATHPVTGPHRPATSHDPPDTPADPDPGNSPPTTEISPPRHHPASKPVPAD